MLKRILIIEDDAELCQEISEILTDEGYLVETASDGDKGKAYLSKNVYHAAVLDYKMPSSTGIDVLKFIKENNLKLKVFVISGKPFIEKLIKDEQLSDIVTCVIGKPFSIQILLNQLKS